jgi:acyl carrier protein
MLDRPFLYVPISDIVRQAIPGLPPQAEIADDQDLRDIGLTSVGSVNLMLALEAAYDLAIPDEELTPANFRTIATIEAMTRRLKLA